MARIQRSRQKLKLKQHKTIETSGYELTEAPASPATNSENACADESCSACADESLRSSETPGGWLGEEIPLLVVTGESKIVLLYSRHRNSKRTK
ncbi:hypothetical protein V9T40_007293 [Parthenolecanium corni]|uniref:Uncharacterized protein n=1 Tax=Parthenolecanium corni TaxID=536013 RepID=A0AAN9YBX3_9HEMI